MAHRFVNGAVRRPFNEERPMRHFLQALFVLGVMAFGCSVFVGRSADPPLLLNAGHMPAGTTWPFREAEVEIRQVTFYDNGVMEAPSGRDMVAVSGGIYYFFLDNKRAWQGDGRNIMRIGVRGAKEEDYAAARTAAGELAMRERPEWFQRSK